jgi:large subunit ribosomal protein L32
VPNPKHKHSKSRRDKRAAHFRLVPRSLSLCPRCRGPKLPHRVCPSCGYYRDRQVVVQPDEE